MTAPAGPQTMPAPGVGALDHLRVLDLTRLLPGPFCTQLLGDLGADVIKIEEPGQGDPARHSQRGALFALVNRNKRSVCLNLKAPEGRDLLLRLVETADVLVESFRPGVMDRLGLGYAALSQRQPRLVYASLSGFGQQGPYRDRAGHDLNYLALSGVLAYNVDDQGRPVLPAVQIADLGAGSFGALAILAAVLSAQHTGRGQALDVSLFGSALAWLPTLLAPLVASGQAAPPGRPTLAGGLPQYQVYATADDRYVTLGALEPKFLQNFLSAVGRTDLLQLSDADQLRQELAAIFRARTRDDWVRDLAAVDTCFAPVLSLDEALADPQAAALDMFPRLKLPDLGQVPQLGLPFKLFGTPGAIRRPPPALGEHTPELAAELGLTPEELTALHARGVV